MKFIPNNLSSRLSVAALKVGKVSPNLMFGAGIVGVVGTAVLASRATLRLEEVLEETHLLVNAAADARKTYGDMYSANDQKRDLALIYFKSAGKVVKLYAPSLAVAAISIGLLTGSHRMLTKRNAALTAAYATLEKGFKSYRNRVIEDLGETKDREYLHGVETEKITETDKDGKKKKTEKSYPKDVSPYGVLFREGNPNWVPQQEYNFMFIRTAQNMTNDQLQRRGHVLLNDVYDTLGFERTQAGCVVGWVKNGEGDGFIDFGVFDRKDADRVHDYLVGRENELFLDFNVDGIIYDKI